MKRFVLAFIAMFVFMFCWGWFVNGIVLKDTYAEMANLMRPRSEMMALFYWIVIGQALLVFAFVMIYAIGFSGGGVISGIKLGILFELAGIGARLALYATTPFTGKMIVYGSIAGLIEMVISGAIVGAIYKPRVATS